MSYQIKNRNVLPSKLRPVKPFLKITKISNLKKNNSKTTHRRNKSIE